MKPDFSIEHCRIKLWLNVARNARVERCRKIRFTVMLCCSVRGEKLKPLVIGNSRKPRCFRNLDVESLPVTWKSNRKSWMTNDIFTEWAKDINRQMRKKSRKIMIFVDNCNFA